MKGGPCHHVRRRFFDLAKSPPAPIATEALKRIAELYQIEAQICGTSADERCAARRGRAKPLVEALKIWLDKTLVPLAGGSSLALGHPLWPEPLGRAGALPRRRRIEIDSNTVERSMRPIALKAKTHFSPAATTGRKTGQCWPR